MASNDLLSRIKEKLPAVAEAFQKDFREELNRNIHILDLSYESLKVNVYARKTLSTKEAEAYNKVYNTLTNVVRQVCSGKTFGSLNDSGFLEMFNRKKSVGPILIDNGLNSFFIVGKSYEAVQSFAAQYINRDPRLKATRFGAYSKFKQKTDARGRLLKDEYDEYVRAKTDIGHISSENNVNLESPLERKIETIISTANLAGSTRVVNLAQMALKELYKVQAEIAYSFRNTTPESINIAKKILGEGYIVVTLHSERLNNKFATQEKKIYDKLLSEIVLSLKLPTVSGSNTISEDIATHIARTISGNKIKLASHQKQSGKVSTNLKSNVKVTPVSLTLGGSEIAEPAPETLSLSNLTALLSSRLALRIKENMGTGYARNVLNYRTGRLANTATIERATLSREGMVSVFYNYMRYPYATFSAGGVQEFPRSRDPKLLISKSIREIGASIAFNRMRAVLV